MSVAAIVSRVRRLQRLKEQRLQRAKALTREDARLVAAASGKTAPLFPEYFEDAVAFATVFLGLRLVRAQRRILEALSRHKRIAIRSGQKTGKSTAFVIAALWWACTRSRARVIFTGPGNRQVGGILWKELRRVCALTAPEGGKTLADKIGVHPAQLANTGMQWPDGREIVGFAADSGGSVQGFSSPELLVIIDEGSEVPDPIFEAFLGNTGSGGSVLAASNPIENTGWFFDAFHEKSEMWCTLHLSSEDSPNITGAEEPIAGLATKEFVDSMLKAYGRDSVFYITRILGNFASTTSTSVVPLLALEEAQKRWKENEVKPRVEILRIGLDVARFGDDDTTIAPRRGPRIYELEEIHGADGNEVAGRVLVVARRMRRPGELPIIQIDGTGGYGAGPADILRAGHAHEVRVVELNSSSKADDEEKYSNLRAQLHFAVAQFLTEGGELPPDAKLKVELLAAKYKFDARRRYLVEPKADIKKRIRRSPDRADAVSLAIYEALPGEPEYEDEYDDDLPKLRV